MPPRHMKSLITSVFWPVWEWITKPHIKWIFASYGQALSTRDSLKCRRLIQSPWFQRNYGFAFKLVGDQNSKIRFENDNFGYRIATSVDGVGTGEGGDRIVVDDPHNIREAESKKVRESTLLWWDEAMSTRGNDPLTCAHVINMQRTHAKDLSGHVLEQGGYEHLCFPAEYEGSKYVTCLGFKDPRTEDGELLWTSRFSREKLEELKKVLGSYAAAGQLQQRPAPREGGIIKPKWWKDRYFIDLPSFSFVIQSWDTAFKTAERNDYSVCTTWGVNNDGYWLIDRWKGKEEFPSLQKIMLELYLKHNPIAVLVEDKASGQSLIQVMKQPITDEKNPNIKHKLPIKPMPADIDKESRANASAPIIKMKVHLPKNAAWKDDFEYNVGVFPNGEHDDDVDSMVHAILFLGTKKQTTSHQSSYFDR